MADHSTPDDPIEEDEDGESVPRPVRAPTTDGGEGRLTVGVTRTDAQPLLRANQAKVVVESRGTRREYELVSLLRRADQRFRRLTVRDGGDLDGVSLGEAALREAFGVAVFAVRNDGDWQIAPDETTTVAAGDELYAVGSRSALDAFAEAVA